MQNHKSQRIHFLWLLIILQVVLNNIILVDVAAAVWVHGILFHKTLDSDLAHPDPLPMRQSIPLSLPLTLSDNRKNYAAYCFKLTFCKDNGLKTS